MRAYVGFVMILNFAVDLLLLCGTDRLLGIRTSLRSALAGASVGAAYAAVCLLPVPFFMTSLVVRMLVLFLMAWITYSLSVRRSALFLLLMLSVGGITTGFAGIGKWELLIAAVCFLVLLFTARSTGTGVEFVPMELSYGGRSMKITALRDTGNGLRDPITGESVIVVGPKIAFTFTGLTEQQLKHPAESLPLLPGGRLIPYRSVGVENGLLMAIRFPVVKVGNRTSNTLVAFAPAGFQENGSFQALVGRM